MKTVLKRAVPSLLSIALCLLAASCDDKGGVFGGGNASLEKAKKATARVGNDLNGKHGDKALAALMTDDFEFRDAEGNVHKGSESKIGAAPFLESIRQDGFLSYEQKITDARDLGGGEFEVDVDAALKIKTPSGEIKTAKWPMCLSWKERNGDMELTAVEYVDAMEWTVSKAPSPPTAEKGEERERPKTNGTRKSSAEKSDRVGDHSAGTCLKVKRSIQSQVEQLNRINRSGVRQ
jgi:hypothetical protein